MPLSTELREALARSRRRLRLRGGTVNQEGGTRAPLLQENSDTVPARIPMILLIPRELPPWRVKQHNNWIVEGLSHSSCRLGVAR